MNKPLLLDLFSGAGGCSVGYAQAGFEVVGVDIAPHIIENVVGAPVQNAITLCGLMFELRVYRHRLFESNVLLFQPPHPRHIAHCAHAGNIPSPEQFYCPVGHLGDKEGSQRAMGIWWMQTQKEIANAIPPAYTHWIGQFLVEYVREVGA